MARTPPASSPAARATMIANRSESSLDRALRSALHRGGLRFRKNLAPVSGLRCKADVAFPRAKVAVFVHGCFWHRCRIHASHPKSNAEWWAAKLAANAARDRRNREVLESSGWAVVELWEHQDLEEMVDRVVAALVSCAQERPNVSPAVTHRRP